MQYIKNEGECFITGSKRWETAENTPSRDSNHPDYIVSMCLEPVMKHEARGFGMSSLLKQWDILESQKKAALHVFPLRKEYVYTRVKLLLLCN